MNRNQLFILYNILFSCSIPNSKLTDFTYSTCIDQSTESEFLAPKLIATKLHRNEALIQVMASTNCGTELIGKIEVRNDQIDLFYTINGLNYDNYAPKSLHVPIIQEPETVEIDSNEINESIINLCYCKYTLTYKITNPPSGFKISSINKWKIE